MTADKKISSMLSLCQKAGKLISGETACEKAIQARQAKLVITCIDASDNTKKKFANKSFFYNVPFYTYSSKEDLSRIIGKENRATVIITDTNFAVKIEELLKVACIE